MTNNKDFYFWTRVFIKIGKKWDTEKMENMKTDFQPDLCNPKVARWAETRSTYSVLLDKLITLRQPFHFCLPNIKIIWNPVRLLNQVAPICKKLISIDDVRLLPLHLDRLVLYCLSGCLRQVSRDLRMGRRLPPPPPLKVQIAELSPWAYPVSLWGRAEIYSSPVPFTGLQDSSSPSCSLSGLPWCRATPAWAWLLVRLAISFPWLTISSFNQRSWAIQ